MSETIKALSHSLRAPLAGAWEQAEKPVRSRKLLKWLRRSPEAEMQTDAQPTETVQASEYEPDVITEYAIKPVPTAIRKRILTAAGVTASECSWEAVQASRHQTLERIRALNADKSPRAQGRLTNQLAVEYLKLFRLQVTLVGATAAPELTLKTPVYSHQTTAAKSAMDLVYGILSDENSFNYGSLRRSYVDTGYTVQNLLLPTEAPQPIKRADLPTHYFVLTHTFSDWPEGHNFRIPLPLDVPSPTIEG